MTNTTTTTDPALILAGIIRQVDGKRELGADALAQAILAHSGSRWGPAATAATPEAGYELIHDDGDPKKLPRDAQVVDGKWWRPRFGCNSLATVLESVQSPTTAPWPELSEKPPFCDTDEGVCENAWLLGFDQGWQAARAELQRQREEVQPPATAAWPEISDSLMGSLICDILHMLAKATDKALGGGYFSPIPQIRARLMEILQLAAQDEAELNHD